MGDSSIEWTDKTWNPVTGCTKVSPGCKLCYAERVFPRAYSKVCKCGALKEDHEVEPHRMLDGCDEFQPREFTDVFTHTDRLEQPLRWRKPARIFVNSMSDLFHEDVPFEFIDKVFAVMALTPRHTYQILTKRPGRMRQYLTETVVFHGHIYPAVQWRLLMDLNIKDGYGRQCDREPWPLPNVWLGVSVESQPYADERIPLLLKTPAAVRFVSYEPALGPVDFALKIPVKNEDGSAAGSIRAVDYFSVEPKVHWVIVGGESGPGARQFSVQWARDVIAQCKAAGVACFVKQLGRMPFDYNEVGLQIDDRKGGDMDEWPADLRVREFPKEVYA